MDMSDISGCSKDIGFLSSMKRNIVEIYESRTILKSLVSKELFGHYRNSFLGFGWHFVMPIIMLCVYYLAFNTIREGSMDNFWVYIASALFPFNFMISNLTGGSGTVVNGAGMIKKMYFPREIIVLAKIISSFIVMLMGYGAVLCIIALSGFPLEPVPLLVLPLLLFLMSLFVTGYCLFFSSITVYIRDIQYALSSISIAFFFVTPMYFVADSVSGLFKTVIWVNPFTYFVEAYHQIVYYGSIPDTPILIMCCLLPLITITIGYIVFKKLERGFAERL